MHRLTATDTPMVRYTRTIFPSYAVDVTSDHIYYPTIPEEVVDIIERNGLHYE